MHHDIRAPTIVIVGQWNPAIFSLDWAARTLFGAASGQTLEIVQTADALRQTVATYMFGVGFSCSPERLEIYLAELSNDGERAAEEFLSKVLATLSHTPVRGIGFNYTFRGVEIEPAISDAFVTPERLREQFTVIVEDHRSRLEFAPGVELNLARKVAKQGAEVAFNFHHNLDNTEAALQFLPGKIAEFRGAAYGLMEKLYGLSEFEVATYKNMNTEAQPNDE